VLLLLRRAVTVRAGQLQHHVLELHDMHLLQSFLPTHFIYLLTYSRVFAVNYGFAASVTSLGVSQAGNDMFPKIVHCFTHTTYLINYTFF
jgi:hypothetical protein